MVQRKSRAAINKRKRPKKLRGKNQDPASKDVVEPASLPPYGRILDDQTNQVVAQHVARRRRAVAAISNYSDGPFPPLGAASGEGTAHGVGTSVAEAVGDASGSGSAHAVGVSQTVSVQTNVERNNPETRHQQLIERVTEVEKLLQNIAEIPKIIGHNNPPEPIEPPTLSEQVLGEIRELLTILKAQPVIPGAKPVDAIAAENKLRKLSNYIVKQADAYFTELVKTAAKATVVAVSPMFLKPEPQGPGGPRGRSRWGEGPGIGCLTRCALTN